MPLTERLEHAVLPGLSTRPWLVRERDDRLYRETLFRHLGERGAREVGFFVNEKRFYLLAHLIEQHAGRFGPRILNAACGPFALEYYCRLDGCEVVSFDIDERLGGVHRALSAAGLIENCHFLVGSAKSVAVSGDFDLVAVNDLFYSPDADYFSMIGECARLVAPGGYLYFDIPDRRAASVWAMAGKAGLARYDLDPVAEHLERLGFAIIDAAPSMGISGGLDELLRRMLWSSLGIANNAAILARAA